MLEGEGSIACNDAAVAVTITFADQIVAIGYAGSIPGCWRNGVFARRPPRRAASHHRNVLRGWFQQFKHSHRTTLRLMDG